MHKDKLKAVFDQQAHGYDKQWERLAPLRDGLYFLVASVLADLPDDARILCVGAGTGAELAYLAQRFPRWRFTAVEPSSLMLDVCRQRAEREGFAPRCVFHEGYIDSLSRERHHAATCFLVSQFILEQERRAELFRAIAERLHPRGLLASSDLASKVGSNDYETLLRMWFTVMSGPNISTEKLARARAAYAKDVAILPPATLASVIESGGFRPPVQFFQAGLLHAWVSERLSEDMFNKTP